MTTFHKLAYNYVDDPEHEKHWFIRTEPRQFDAAGEEEIDRHVQNSLIFYFIITNALQGLP